MAGIANASGKVGKDTDEPLAHRIDDYEMVLSAFERIAMAFVHQKQIAWCLMKIQFQFEISLSSMSRVVFIQRTAFSILRALFNSTPINGRLNNISAGISDLFSICLIDGRIYTEVTLALSPHVAVINKQIDAKSDFNFR